MRPMTNIIPLLAALLAFLVLPFVQGRPRQLTREERVANILAQKPLHTTALLAGAAAMPTPSPYPPGSSDLGYTQRPPKNDESDELAIDDNGDGYEIQVEL